MHEKSYNIARGAGVSVPGQSTHNQKGSEREKHSEGNLRKDSVQCVIADKV